MADRGSGILVDPPGRVVKQREVPELQRAMKPLELQRAMKPLR